MKWNGIVSHRSQPTIASRFAIANATQASSTALCRSEPIPGMANRFDRRVWTELLAEPANADVDDIRVRIEVIAPDLGEQSLAADHLAGAFEQAVKEPELAVREIDHSLPELRLASGEVERERAGLQDVPVVWFVRLAQVDANSRQQLVKRERLR